MFWRFLQLSDARHGWMAAIGLADLGPSCCAGWFWWFGGAKKVRTCQNNHAIHFYRISSPNQLFIHHDHEHKDIYWHFTSLLYLAMTCWFLRFLCWLRSRLAKQARGTYLYMVLGLFDFNLLCFFTLTTSARVAIQHVIHMRVEQKVHERGFLCVSLWVCNEQSRLKFFLKWRKIFFFWLKFWRKFM